MRKLILIAIMAIPAIFASCSQETEDIQGPVRKDIGRRETVTEKKIEKGATHVSLDCDAAAKAVAITILKDGNAVETHSIMNK